MFYAFGSCKAAKCEFLHDDSNKYTGPPPRSLAPPKADAKAKPKPKPKPKPKAAATIAPLISAMPAAQAQDKVTWIWDTGAGRHLIGKQALNRKAAACVRRTDSPVGFATGGGAHEGNQTLSFEGSRLLAKDEQVYVSRSVLRLFPLVKPSSTVDTCSCGVLERISLTLCQRRMSTVVLRVPRNARINATSSSTNSSHLGLPAQAPLLALLPLHFHHLCSYGDR